MGALTTDFRTFTVPVSGTSGDVELEDWDTLGLLVPTIDNSTLQLKVSQDRVSWFPVYDANGTQVLSWADSTGDRAFGSRDMADVAGYKYLGVFLGSAQNSAARTFTLTFKAPKRQ